ncbi:MAG: hypothetical protein L0H70_01210 [Xanthomonadales bacterium]|nr:hypothetical protein [Xanthomonadales bacterium]
MAALTYPLQLQFKLVALAPQIFVRNANGEDVLYVHQKLFKLKEAISVYRDTSKTQTVYKIAADRIIDFGARYHFTDAAGQPLGALKRQGARSIWRATYDVFSAADEAPKLRIVEEKPWTKVLDSLVGEIPLVGMFTGYFLNPSYVLKDVASDETIWRVTKRRTFTDSQFTIESLSALPPATEQIALLGVLTMTLLERERG